MTRYSGPRWETPKPRGVAGSYGPAVTGWAKRRLGLEHGRWQAHALDGALRHDRNGDLIARVALLSTGRQCGKSVIVRSFFGWMLDEGQHLPPFAAWRELLLAAHDAKQARLIYKALYRDLLDIPDLAAAAKEPTRKKAIRLTEHF